ncbi:MAG: hypothetical protein WCA78_00495 [Rhizomicrobium sp.]
MSDRAQTFAMPTSARGDYVGTVRSSLHRERFVRIWFAAALIVIGAVSFLTLTGRL